MEFELSQCEEQVVLLGRREQVGTQGPDRRVRVVLIQLEKIAMIENLRRRRTRLASRKDIGGQGAMDVTGGNAPHAYGRGGAGEHMHK
jgi:hypothetical protein